MLSSPRGRTYMASSRRRFGSSMKRAIQVENLRAVAFMPPSQSVRRRAVKWKGRRSIYPQNQ